MLKKNCSLFSIIYLYCEKLPKISYFTNTKTLYFYIPDSWFYLYNQILSNSLGFYQTTLIEHSLINNLEYSHLSFLHNKKPNNLLNTYIYYNYIWDVK